MARNSSLLTAVACMGTASLFAATQTQATTIQIVNDNFNGVGETVGDDAGVPLDVAWSRIQPNATPNIGATKGVGGTPALGDTGSSNQYRGMIGLLPSAFALSDTGDQIVLDADFRSNNAPALPAAGVANGYRVGLFTSSGTGYFIDVGALDQDTAPVNFGSLTLEEDTGGSNLAGNDGDSVVRDSVASGAPVINSNAYRHFKLTLTKTATGIQVDADYENGAHTLGYLDNTPVASIDRIFFGTGGHSVDYWVDNVTVETTDIPEPSSLALLGLGGLLVARRRRG